jgi:hypothetical protein
VTHKNNNSEVESILLEFADYAEFRQNGYDLEEATKALNTLLLKERESHFQAIVPDEGPDMETKGTFDEGYTQAIKDVCDNHYATLNNNLNVKE